METKENTNQEEKKPPKVYDIPLDKIDDFPNHPFRVRLDEDMEQLVESVMGRGLITPITLRRKDDGRYEVVSGHRRKKACELAGLQTIQAELRDLTHDEAVILMVDANLQRSVILPSEKAFSYKMRLEAMKRQGRRTDLTSSPVATKWKGRQSLEIIGENAGDSRNQVHRYIRLTELIPQLLDMVDEGSVAFRAGVELSYLAKSEQAALLNAMATVAAIPSLEQANKLKKLSQKGRLTEAVIRAVLRNESIPSIAGEPEKERAVESQGKQPEQHRVISTPTNTDDGARRVTSRDALNTIKAALLDFQAVCEFYLKIFPELLGDEKGLFFETLGKIEAYLQELHEEESSNR